MGRFVEMPEGGYYESVTYGIAPDGNEQSWAILCTVEGAQGPFRARRTVVRGPWVLDPSDPRSE